ncbi:MAG TPA: AI-2E family transporter YdiK [Anaeromyxobacter sp.]|nr:AI-2E family transporter YdiK [Anaeromyxobacter sp.]
MTTAGTARDLSRTTLSVISIFGLLAATFLVLKPFLPAIVWATTIVVATWPLLVRLQSWFGGRRGLAVAVMTVALLAVIVVPLYLAISTIVSSADRVIELFHSFGQTALPTLPEWMGKIPLLGPKLKALWDRIGSGGLGSLGTALVPYASRAIHVLATQAGSFGAMVVQFVITVGIAAVLYATGEASALAARRFFRRLAGERGEDATVLAAKAVRSVALGVMVTAVVQACLAGIGLAIAGVPYAGLLTAVALVLCVAQVGPALILIPAIIWLFVSGQTGVGVFLAVFSVAPLTVDNILRPILIRKGAPLPLWLILSGVIGGLLAFGVIGLFIGPVVLAVSYTLVQAWVAELGPEPGPASPKPPGHPPGAGETP